MSWPTGKKMTLQLHGALIPWLNNAPYLVHIFGSDRVHVALFSSKAKLDRARDEGVVRYDSTKQIDEPAVFLESLPGDLWIAFDLHRTERGTISYKLLDPKNPEWETV